MTVFPFRTVLLIVDALIIICIAVGFINLYKFITASKDKNADEKQEGIKKIIRQNGILLAILGLIAIAIGVTAKLI